MIVETTFRNSIAKLRIILSGDVQEREIATTAPVRSSGALIHS